MTLYKIGRVVEDASQCEWIWPDVWATEVAGGTERILMASSGSPTQLLSRLADAIPEPMWLLYVLLVSRRDNVPGRYQSPSLESRDALKAFLFEFQDFLEHDGRHNLWIRSGASPAMLVWDRHNRIYGYGVVDEFRDIAIAAGLCETDSAEIRPPTPHAHHYHAEFDDQEDRLLAKWAWHHTPLSNQDDE